tara:strand:+ start:988 stop:1368 length:381 start_codon:yes stop_codon:yes gene_type:complete
MNIKDNIFYNKVIGKNRYLLSKDKYSWVWLYGSKESSVDNIYKNTNNRYYYTTIQSLLTNVFEKRFKSHMTKFTLKSILKALREAYRDILDVSSTLDKVTWGVLDRGDYCPTCDGEIKKGKKQCLG